MQHTLPVAFVVGLVSCLAGCGAAAPHPEEAVRDPEPAPGPVEVADATQVLLEAAYGGRADLVGEALDRGADANAAGSDGRTPLMLAAYGGHTAILGLLLDQGARVDGRDPSGRTALMYAASGPNTEPVRRLLDAKADPNLVDSEERFTALMFAAAEGHADVVRALLERGADPALTDVDGDAALDFAAQNGHEVVSRILNAEPAPRNDP